MSRIAGGNVIPGSGERLGTARVALSATAGNGGLLHWQNPEPHAIAITRLVIDVTTPATGAATANFGSGATASTASDNLIDTVDVGTAAILADNLENAGTNGKAIQRLDANGGTTDYVTGTASADPAGLVGYAYIEYRILD